MKLFVGTSGWAYPEWKGSFYPEKISQKLMLSYYAERLSTVEINYTFRQLPKQTVVESWVSQVPEGFKFVLKARQVITHFKRLKDAAQETVDFLRVASYLGDHQGPVLFQLPPNMKKDVERLDAFLKQVDAPSAFEFRHESWHDEEVFECLRAHKVALCVADAEELPHVDLISTANWGFLRLRRVEYTDKQLKEWIKQIKDQSWDHCYIFFKHEDEATGPKLATKFLELSQ